MCTPKPHTRMFMPAPFIKSPNWKQFKVPSKANNKMYIYIIVCSYKECSTVVKRDKSLLHAKIWMNLTDVKLSARHKHKNIHNKWFRLYRQNELMVMEWWLPLTEQWKGAQSRLLGCWLHSISWYGWCLHGYVHFVEFTKISELYSVFYASTKLYKY